MNAAPLMTDSSNPEVQLISHALMTLEERTAIKATFVALGPEYGQLKADATVELQHPNGTHRYLVECKSSIDRKAQLNQVRLHLERLGADGLLITYYLGREMAESCRTTDLQFIDLCGNAHLHAPGLFVLMTGESPALRDKPSTNRRDSRVRQHCAWCLPCCHTRACSNHH